MIATDHIETRCVRVAHTLQAPGADQVALLRSARILKGVHEDLRRAVWERSGRDSRTELSQRAMRALDGVEDDLRTVLLEYAGMPARQMRSYLEDALDRVLDALEMLEPRLVLKTG